MLEMVEVPLAGGKKGVLLKGTLVKINYLNRLETCAHVAEDGYELVGFAGKVMDWKNCYVAEVYKKADPPEAVIELSQRLGAVYKSRNDPTVYLAASGVTSKTEKRLTVWKDVEGDYWTPGIDKGYRMWVGGVWGPDVPLEEDPFELYAPLVEATDEFYAKEENA